MGEATRPARIGLCPYWVYNLLGCVLGRLDCETVLPQVLQVGKYAADVGPGRIPLLRVCISVGFGT